MNRSIVNLMLLALCSALALLGGCFPDDSLDWSADGSVGLLRANEALYLVDGKTGKLTPVKAETVSPMPDISRDGAQIAYSDGITYATLAEGLRALPPGQAEMIQKDAQSLREKILGGIATVTEFNSARDNTFGYGEPYRGWVVRYMCENADEPLVQKLGAQLLQQGKESELTCSRLIVAPYADPAKVKVVATSAMVIFRPRFSPDGKNVAYLTSGNEDIERAHLFVASPGQNMPAVYVAARVALGFDWREDSQAIAYVQQEADDDAILGVIFERQVCDSNGSLLEEVSADAPDNPLEIHRSTGPSKSLVGTLFQPLLKVEYGAGGRLFFSSASGRIPASDLDEPKYLLFCHDPVTGTVADVLPSDAPAYIGETVNFFSLSPDGRRVLLPMENNRFAIYELGTKSLDVPISEAEQFGEDLPDFLPSWKGNDKVSCLVSEKSHFLAGSGAQEKQRKEIVVMGTNGDLHSILSADWPDDAIP